MFSRYFSGLRSRKLFSAKRQPHYSSTVSTKIKEVDGPTTSSQHGEQLYVPNQTTYLRYQFEGKENENGYGGTQMDGKESR